MKRESLNESSTGQKPADISIVCQCLNLGLLLLFVGCAKQDQPAPNALARVGDNVVTEAGFRSWWEEHQPAADTAEARQLVLNQLIERSALAQTAREAGLDKDPDVIEQMENLLIGRLKETRLQPELKSLAISEKELQETYDQDAASKYSIPERTRVAVLWFDTRGQAPLVARYTPRLEQARQAAAALPVNRGFGPLAVQNTEHRASRYQGGDVGWLEDSPANNPWKKQVLEIVSQLKQPGELSQVIITDCGLFLVRLIERQPAHVRSFASVREGIEQRLLSARRQQMEDQFKEQILDRMKVRQFPEHLEALQNLPTREMQDPATSPFRLSAN